MSKVVIGAFTGSTLGFCSGRRWLYHNMAGEVAKLPDSSNQRQDQMEGNILKPDEIRLLLDAAVDRWRIVIMMAVLTGLREGELLIGEHHVGDI
jgi:integrase